MSFITDFWWGTDGGEWADISSSPVVSTADAITHDIVSENWPSVFDQPGSHANDFNCPSDSGNTSEQ